MSPGAKIPGLEPPMERVQLLSFDRCVHPKLTTTFKIFVIEVTNIFLSKRLDFKSKTCPFLLERTQWSHFITLSLSFPSCDVGIIILTRQWRCETRRERLLWHVVGAQ